MRYLTLIILIACAAWSWFSVLDHAAQYGKIGNDFVQDYSAGLAAREGRPIYGDHIGLIAAAQSPGWKSSDYNNFHPPLLALLAIPFTFSPIDQAFVNWNLALALLFPLATFLVCKRLGINDLSCAAVIAALPFWMPAFSTFCLGQANGLLLILLVACWIYWREPHGRTRDLAAIPLAIASLIKMFPAFLLLIFVIEKRWRALFIFSAVFIGGMSLCAAILGSQTVLYYAQNIIPRDVEEWAVFPINHSIHGMIRRAFASTKFTLPLYQAPEIVPILIFGLNSLVVVANFFFLSWIIRGAKSELARDIIFWSQLVPMFLVSPITWQHSLVLLIPLLLTLCQHKKSSYHLAAFLCVGALSFLDVEIARSLVVLYPHGIPWQISTLAVNLPFFTLLALAAFIYSRKDIENCPV